VPSELGVALAVLLRNWRTLRRYPVSLFGLVLLPLYQVVLPSLLLGATFSVGGRALGLLRTGGTSDLSAFLFLGAFVTCLTFGAFWGTSLVVSAQVNGGSLESGWLTPASRSGLALGEALSAMAMASIAGLILLAVGSLVFGARYLPALAAAAPVLLVAMVGMVGVSYAVAASVLWLRDATFLVDAGSFLFAAASGAMLPVAILPLGLRLLALALPTTYAADLMRSGALGAPSLFPTLTELGLLALTSVALLVLGRALFALAVRRVLREGTLSGH
jgi:ABC-2 type transport system permease protein